jgi:hypothetical protein
MRDVKHKANCVHKADAEETGATGWWQRLCGKACDIVSRSVQEVKIVITEKH